MGGAMTNKSLDRVSGLIFAALGALVILGSLNMPRFEAQGAHAYQAPGLTPGLLGLALAFSGLFLAFRPAGDQGQKTTFWDTIVGSPVNRKRAAVALVLTLGYAGGLFGNAPFALATFLFVFAFIVTFEILLKPEGSSPRVGVTLIAAGVIGLLASFGSQYAFQTLFLIQLP